MSKANHCDECRHATIKWYEYKGQHAFDVLTCAKGHKPRYYAQRNDNPLDSNWGWKRVCADFETANAVVQASGAQTLNEGAAA